MAAKEAKIRAEVAEQLRETAADLFPGVADKMSAGDFAHVWADAGDTTTTKQQKKSQ